MFLLATYFLYSRHESTTPNYISIICVTVDADIHTYIYTYIYIYIYIYTYIVYVTVNVMKLIIIHISWLLCIISSPVEKSDEKRKFYQFFRLFCIIFMLNGEYEYQIDYLSQ